MPTSAERAARERKQKIFVVVGGVVLLGLLALQLPRLLGGSSSSAAPAAETTAADLASLPTGTQPRTQTSVALVDTDRPLAPAPGKLSSFTVFARKDPFVQQVTSSSPSTGSTGSGGGAQSATKDTSKAQAPSAGFTVGETSTALATVISVNGTRQVLVPGAAFPAADPVFVLVGEQPDSKAVVIGIAGGAYASGAKTTKLKIGKPIVLVNTTTGARYRLVLVAVGNGSASTPATPTAGSSSKQPQP